MSEQVGSWFDYHIKKNPKRSLMYLIFIGGFFFTLWKDSYQLTVIAKVILYVVGGLFTYIAFYGHWLGLKRR